MFSKLVRGLGGCVALVGVAPGCSQPTEEDEESSGGSDHEDELPDDAVRS